MKHPALPALLAEEVAAEMIIATAMRGKLKNYKEQPEQK
jgi:hypothetical protein